MERLPERDPPVFGPDESGIGATANTNLPFYRGTGKEKTIRVGQSNRMVPDPGLAKSAGACAIVPIQRPLLMAIAADNGRPNPWPDSTDIAALAPGTRVGGKVG